MRRIIVIIVAMLFFSQTVLAHDGSDHTSDLEMLIAGIGLFFIVATCIYIVWWNHSHQDELIEYDNFGTLSEPDTEE